MPRPYLSSVICNPHSVIWFHFSTFAQELRSDLHLCTFLPTAPRSAFSLRRVLLRHRHHYRRWRQPTNLDLTEPHGLAFGLQGDVTRAQHELRTGVELIGGR